jgi:hypothetical protein
VPGHRRDRLAELLTALPPEEEATLTLAVHVALPIIPRLIHNANQSHTQGTADRLRRVRIRVGRQKPDNWRTVTLRNVADLIGAMSSRWVVQLSTRCPGLSLSAAVRQGHCAAQIDKRWRHAEVLSK